MSTRTNQPVSAPVERLRQALRLAAPGVPTTAAAGADRLLITPVKLRVHLEHHLAGQAGRIRVTGTLDRRLVLIERLDGTWVAADLSGQPHDTRNWPAWLTGHIEIEEPGKCVSLAEVDDHAAYRFTRPDLLLCALYHPEYFPLPRFPLGISDVARAARSTLLGEVTLADMQVGVTLPDLIETVTEQTPDILGISATSRSRAAWSPASPTGASASLASGPSGGWTATSPWTTPSSPWRRSSTASPEAWSGAPASC
jgi:hypothetical protein